METDAIEYCIGVTLRSNDVDKKATEQLTALKSRIQELEGGIKKAMGLLMLSSHSHCRDVYTMLKSLLSPTATNKGDA